MLELGVFNGTHIADEPDEFPKSWFTHVKKANYSGRRTPEEDQRQALLHWAYDSRRI